MKSEKALEFCELNLWCEIMIPGFYVIAEKNCCYPYFLKPRCIKKKAGIVPPVILVFCSRGFFYSTKYSIQIDSADA